MLLKVSTVRNRSFLLVQSADHLTGLTGATPTVTLSKDGGAFAAAGGTVTEIANGVYKIALTTTDTNTKGDLFYHVTAASGDPTDFADQVVTDLPGDTVASVTAGVTLAAAAVDNVALATSGINAIWAAASRTLTGNQGIKKNTALAAFPFLMTDSTTHAPKTGLTVTATRSLDGAAFGACTNSVVEVGSGWYKIDLSAGDTNGNTVALRFTATNADDRNLSFATSS